MLQLFLKINFGTFGILYLLNKTGFVFSFSLKSIVSIFHVPIASSKKIQLFLVTQVDISIELTLGVDIDFS